MNGARIAFWGPVHGQVATTSNMLAAATGLAADYKSKKTLVTHTHQSNTALETGYLKNHTLSENNFINFTDSGLDALARYARSRKLEPSLIKDYTHHIFNQLDLLYGTNKTDDDMESMIEDIRVIIDKCRQFYDFTFIDVNSGSQNKVTNAVLQHSDLIVVCLSQNITLLDRFFVKKEWDWLLEDKPYVVVVGQYDKDSHYSCTNIGRKYKYKGPLFTVPRCSHYLDAYNQNSVAEFFMRNRNIDRRDEDYFFFTEVRRLIKGILSETGMTKLLSDRGA
ncbi:hypothetical protein YDYSY3_39550 [Paenibacillus chitinolyticus]|uniref:chromosome partitioning protein ParA n=1 Tax=Paenibacillus chitinolyticus TaxID=79263 RepID=UPI0026E49862|nr:chromosome partitioning protein ParA [Paenibacillus chitinolyticus]GKS12955.1 hypothetical protein YDYSY3_39550 [Paenibacillus chitinolyticus]